MKESDKIKEILDRIEDLAVNPDTESMLVLERDSFDDLKNEYLKKARNDGKS